MINRYIFDLDGTLCDSMRLWRKECGSELEEVSDWEPVFDRMREHYRNLVPLKTGVFDFIRGAHARGVKMCIATGTRRDVCQPFLEKTGIMEFMESFVDCYEVKAYKDRPDVYIEAAKRLNADISDCAVFEDTPYAAETAKKAGFFVAGVFDEVTSLDGDLKAFSDIYIEDWKNANALLSSLA